MNKKEFIDKIIGTPWVNRAYGFDGCDCFGLVYLYYSQVLGLIPTLTDEYLSKYNFTVAFQCQLDAGEWKKVERPDGDEVVFVCFDGDVPLHCGVMIDRNNVLHAFGSDKNQGQAIIWNMAVMLRYLKRYYKMNEQPRVEFYKWRS